LTSSSTRHVETKTRVLARLDDLLYDDEGRLYLVQTDWTSILQAGSSVAAHLQNLARAQVDSALEGIQNAVNLQRHWENIRHWWESSSISLDDVLETGARVLMATPNTLRAVVNEAGWEIYSAIEIIKKFSDDPLLSVFGDFLTAGPSLRQHLRSFYEDVGLDSHHAVKIATTTIVDRRTARLSLYPAAARYTAGSADYTLANDRQRRTVGCANAGFVRLATRGNDVLEVHHELRWYPIDEPERHTNPTTRTDWMGTLHRLGWRGTPADAARAGAP
jgi:hypothetical protein